MTKPETERERLLNRLFPPGEPEKHIENIKFFRGTHPGAIDPEVFCAEVNKALDAVERGDCEVFDHFPGDAASPPAPSSPVGDVVREERCPFCGHDPFHRVDNGCGMEAVAVNCCELGCFLYGKSEETPITREEVLAIVSKFTAQATRIAELEVVARAYADLEDVQKVRDLEATVTELRAEVERWKTACHAWEATSLEATSDRDTIDAATKAEVSELYAEQSRILARCETAEAEVDRLTGWIETNQHTLKSALTRATAAESALTTARGALEPFAKIADVYDERETSRTRAFKDEGRSPGPPLGYYHLITIATLSDCRRAREALAALPAKQAEDGE